LARDFDVIETTVRGTLILVSGCSEQSGHCGQGLTLRALTQTARCVQLLVLVGAVNR
jgi:hypothetical protein